MEDQIVASIDIAPLLQAGARAGNAEQVSVADQMLRASESHGLFFVTGHGIDTATRSKAFRNARHFFDLPDIQKSSIPAHRGGFTRGYIGFGGESGSQRLECKEAFSYGYPWLEDRPPENALQGCNVWPDVEAVSEGWRDDMLGLFREMVFVSLAIARGLSFALDLRGDDNLEALCQGGDTISLMRLFHYFPYDNTVVEANSDRIADRNADDSPDDNIGQAARGHAKREAPEKIGSSPHTDWGFLTCILQDQVGGLQFLDESNNTWVNVPCSNENALVVNCGDFLSLLTNGRLK